MTFTFSCAKVSYLWNQGLGQLTLFRKGVKNEVLLQRNDIPEEVKSKIRKIEELKKHFYKYWTMEPTGIYSETTLLGRDAVTYLVIASPFDTIKARENCFPFMGCFPYLGFFSEEQAKSHQLELEEGPWVTYRRPVYAYSTLGYFEDNILSSFFHYDEFGLTELIFHELFHTLFFIDDEVDLNESLANFFAREMALEFYLWSPKQKASKEAREDKLNALNELIVDKAKVLQDNYKKKAFNEKKVANAYLNFFLENEFKPAIAKKCQKLELKTCYPLKREWNNASFAAFLTYEKEGAKIKELFTHVGQDLKGFFHYIKAQYETYEEEDPEGSFTKFLMRPLVI